MPVQHFGELLNSPQKLRNHIFKVLFAAFCLAVISSLTVDQALSIYYANPNRDAIRAFFKLITDIGLSEYYFVGSLLVWVFAKWVTPYLHILKDYHKEQDFARRWGVNFFVALLVSGIMVHIVKFTFGRQRPHKSPEFDPFIFNHFTTHWHWHSFASGHSQVMFTVATMMSVAFPKAKWLFISAAMLLCYSRVVVLDHFLSDTIFGAAIGYCGALLAMYLMKRKSKNPLF